MGGKESSLNNSSDLVVDSISALPDSILGAILSLLPTKNVVATSALSKRWEFVWKTVHNLDFYYFCSYYKLDLDADNMKFVRFVDRVMLLHDNGWLNKFSLDWQARSISSHVNSWINIAVTKNALSRDTVSLSTEFKRLMKLEAWSYCSSSLQDVIQNSENLEELINHQRSIYNVHDHSRWITICNVHDHARWITPVEVPRCLSNSLKKVEFYGYEGLEDEREMIRYLLKYGNALENMWISCYKNGHGEKL